MSTDNSSAVNGHYGIVNQYDMSEGSIHSQSTQKEAPAPNGAAAQQSNGAGAANTQEDSSVSKDEVGWYFVEQYYTTMSKSPEKLHVCLPPPRSYVPHLGPTLTRR